MKDDCNRAHRDDRNLVAYHAPRRRHERGELRRSKRLAEEPSPGSTAGISKELMESKAEENEEMRLQLHSREPGWIAKDVKKRRRGRGQTWDEN